MPPKSKPPTPKKKPEDKAQRARRLLAGSTHRQEYSEDDLDDEDEPWEWIYDAEDIQEEDRDEAVTPSRKGRPRFREKRIIGAKTGKFRCKIGDCVVLKPDRNEVWAGIICGFREDGEEDDMEAKIMCKKWKYLRMPVSNSAQGFSQNLTSRIRKRKGKISSR